jgi:hypothetical protein
MASLPMTASRRRSVKEFSQKDDETSEFCKDTAVGI